MVPKEYNPKGIALFLTGYCNIYKFEKNEENLKKIVTLADLLIDLKAKGYKNSCWGYNFDWQSRAFFLPRNTPTIVATSFCADALMNAYELTKDKKYLYESLDSANFIMNDLNKSEKESGFIFSYSPFDNTKVYNASLLGSRLLARAFYYTKNEKFKDLSRKSVEAVVNCQNKDGSWYYGESSLQKWIDSFHTGYNIECIHEYMKYTDDYSFNHSLRQGLDYYINNFFLKDGTPKYYSSSTYPIDIHSPAQFIATISKIDSMSKYKNLVDSVLDWTIREMQDKSGYFFFQRNKSFTSKIPYMRWSQSWMFYAMTYYLWSQKNEF
tara:strand:- start:940 stop:1911 length:972 start_codon:yes stop_codon:yes gene_type:complete